jgi:membrane protein YdbS with pleckstrin-like domain
MNALERGQLSVWRVQAFITAFLVLAGAGIGEFVLGRTGVPIPGGLVFGAAVLLMIYPTFIAPGRHYRSWGWRVDADELHLHRGVWTKLETIVPFRRVQHIDVSQSWLEGAFHVTSLVLHTAGTVDHRVVLPGLDRETAEKIRDEVRGVIARQDDGH